MMLDVLIAVACVVVFWIIQNCVHEGSHILAALSEEGRKPKGFWPFPGIRDGRWYFAYCSYGEKRWSTGEPWAIHSAPMRSAVCVFSISAVLTYMIHSSGYGRWWIGLIPSGMSAIDFLFFWYGYFWGSKYTDGKKYRYLRSKES